MYRSFSNRFRFCLLKMQKKTKTCLQKRKTRLYLSSSSRNLTKQEPGRRRPLTTWQNRESNKKMLALLQWRRLGYSSGKDPALEARCQAGKIQAAWLCWTFLLPEMFLPWIQVCVLHILSSLDRYLERISVLPTINALGTLKSVLFPPYLLQIKCIHGIFSIHLQYNIFSCFTNRNEWQE